MKQRPTFDNFTSDKAVDGYSFYKDIRPLNSVSFSSPNKYISVI